MQRVMILSHITMQSLEHKPNRVGLNNPRDAVLQIRWQE